MLVAADVSPLRRLSGLNGVSAADTATRNKKRIEAHGWLSRSHGYERPGSGRVPNFLSVGLPRLRGHSLSARASTGMLLPISRQFLKSAHSEPKRQVLGQIGARSRDVRRAILAHSPCIASAFACQTRSLNGRT